MPKSHRHAKSILQSVAEAFTIVPIILYIFEESLLSILMIGLRLPQSLFVFAKFHIYFVYILKHHRFECTHFGAYINKMLIYTEKISMVPVQG